MTINAQGQPQWPREKELKPQIFEINVTVFDIVREALKALDKKAKLREAHLHIYEIFVEKDFNKEK